MKGINNTLKNKIDNIRNKNTKIIPVVRYNNVDTDKSKIYEENNNKSGIYL
jgi:hypothetical protein